jgi:hypothetical protein
MNRLQCWVAAWIDIAVGLTGVLTFTLYRPWWDFHFSCWAVRRNLKAKIAIEEEDD